MERISITEWNNRISPVLDSAMRFIIVDIQDGQILTRRIRELATGDARARAALLVEEKVDRVFCGAVSQDLARMLTCAGVDIIPWMAGEVEEILTRYISNCFKQTEHLMPGCGRRRRNRCGRDHDCRFR